MRAVSVGNKYRVYLEDDSGNITELDAYAVSLSVTQSYMFYGDPEFRGPHEYEINLRGVGELVTRQSVLERRTLKEWKCTYCNRPNQRADETCKSCGAVRSFVYD